MSSGRLFVISGASGVGKSTVLGMVMQDRSDLRFSVSATTRAPRPGEVDGVDYTFVTRETFQKMVAEDAFLEYDDHMNNCYGTPKAQVEEKLKTGSVILDVDVNGAMNVRKVRPDAVLIFIAPPSLEDLEKRLLSRGDTSKEQMQLRLQRADWEMAQSANYDHVVVNDRARACADQILKIISDHTEEIGGK